MSQLVRYSSVEQLKASSRPANPGSVKINKRHDQFERFINQLKAHQPELVPFVDKDASVSAEQSK